MSATVVEGGIIVGIAIAFLQLFFNIFGLKKKPIKEQTKEPIKEEPVKKQLEQKISELETKLEKLDRQISHEDKE